MRNAVKWTADLIAEIAKGGDKVKLRQSKYRTPGIKEALIKETRRKCAYCESFPLHVAFGDVEHVIPKSIDPAQSFSWNNLTLACGVCNTNKADKLGLLDPYSCNPDDEFEFAGPMIAHRRGRVEAENTKIEIDLNRIELLERRREAIDRIVDKLDRLAVSQDPRAKDLIRRAILNHETGMDREFSACVRAYVSAKEAAGEL